MKDGNYSSSNEKKSQKFLYKDKFARDGWLNMMNERLQLAKNLLADDGVIFVSIDDNEQAYLKVLMDEIFGEENFIANIARPTQYGGANRSKILIKKDYDYVLIYANNKNKIESLNKFINKWDDYDQEDERGRFVAKHGIDENTYNKVDAKKTFPININGKDYYPREGYQWNISENRAKWMAENNWIFVANSGILFKKNYQKYKIKKKNDQYLAVEKGTDVQFSTSKMLENDFAFENKKLRLIKNDDKLRTAEFIDKKFNTQSGTMELKQILNNKNFLFPKSVYLIKHLITLFYLVDNKNARILDFFAGSGTTAQAVLELNREDNGNRTFTIVTNDENNIAIDITYERLFRIIKGKGTKGENFLWSEKNKPFSDTKLKVFKIVEEDIKLNNPNFNIDEKVKKYLQSLIPNYDRDSKDLLNNIQDLYPLQKENK